jgi:hypothetical protein
MCRAICVLAAALAVVVPPRVDVDAVTFALAFRAGSAGQYKDKQISGVGTSFHGPIRERIGDGSTRTSLVITLGAADPDGKLTPLATWDGFVEAERAHTTLVVALSGPALPAEKTDHPVVYEFSGVYDGQVRTVARVPQAAGSSAADSGPCPGEQPKIAAEGAGFYCAPLLTGATATPKR